MDESRERKRSRSLGDEEISRQLPAASSSSSIISPSKTISIEAATRPPVSPGADHDNEFKVSTDLQPPVMHMKPAVLVPKRPITKARADLANEESVSEQSDRGKSRKKLKRQKIVDRTADDSASDESDVGLPLERYQPRPSRTRSGRADEDIVTPIDFSKRPEKVGRDTKKAGKEKPAKLHVFEDHPGTKSIDQSMEPSNKTENGSPTNDLKTMESTSKDRDNAIYTEQSCSRENMDAAPQPPKKSRGRPKKVVQNEATNAPKSGGQNACHTSNPEPDFPDGGQGNKSESEIVPKTSVLEEKPANAGLASCNSAAIQGSPPSNAEEIQPKTPDKPSKAGPKGPDKHSPINSGKVAYRVGLSKRARIEPLLRIVRK